jgi:hypothetical protein
MGQYQPRVLKRNLTRMGVVEGDWTEEETEMIREVIKLRNKKRGKPPTLIEWFRMMKSIGWAKVDTDK